MNCKEMPLRNVWGGMGEMGEGEKETQASSYGISKLEE